MKIKLQSSWTFPKTKKSPSKNVNWTSIFPTSILVAKLTLLSNYSSLPMKKKQKLAPTMSPPQSSSTFAPSKRSIPVGKTNKLASLLLILISSQKKPDTTWKKWWNKLNRKSKRQKRKRNPNPQLWRMPPLKQVQSRRKDSKDLEKKIPHTPNLGLPWISK